MTLEEAIKMIKAKLECMTRDVSGKDSDCNMRRCDECSLNYDQGNMGEQKEWLKMSIQALEQEPRWIPVSEKLPEEDGEYLLFGKIDEDEENYIFIGEYDSCGEQFGIWQEQFDRTTLGCLGSEFFEYSSVIAWQPLPQPYRAESEE